MGRLITASDFNMAMSSVIAGDAKKVRASPNGDIIEKGNVFVMVSYYGVGVGQTDFNILRWSPMDVFGMKGKTITEEIYSVYGSQKTNIAWHHEAFDLLKHASTLDENGIANILKKLEADFLEEEGSELKIQKTTHVLKAIDKSIPVPSSLNLQNFSGKDISVMYKTGYGIKIVSRKDSEEADAGHMVDYLTIPQSLSNIKKIEALKSKLIGVIGLNSVREILKANKIPYQNNNHMQLGWD